MYTIDEIEAQLKMDPDLKLFFVEGDRDLSFWRKLAPITKRHNSQVFKIGIITDIDTEKDGEKGRLIKLANYFLENEISKRLKVFIDSDNDKLLNINHPDLVISTDYRDLESYCFSRECINEVISNGLAKQNFDIEKLLSDIKGICIPIGLLRAISEKNIYQLPFYKTFENKGRRKFLIKGEFKLNIDKLVTTLVQNSRLEYSIKDEIISKLENELNKYAMEDEKNIIQGKDWFYYFSHILELEYDSIEAMMFLSLDYHELKSKPQIIKAVNYLTTENLIAI